MSADDFVQDVGILHKRVVHHDKLVIAYHVEGVSQLKVHKLTNGRAQFLQDIVMPE